MDEKERLNKQIWKHMYYNMIAFAIVFIVFGILAFILVTNITFNSVDKELMQSANLYKEAASEVKPIKEGLKFFDKQFANNVEETLNEMEDLVLSRKINNPKIITLLRDENGNILNEEDLSRRYSDLIDEVPFTKSDYSKIYSISLGNDF